MCTVIPPQGRRLFVPMTTLRLMVCCDITRKRSNCGKAALQFQPSKDAERHPGRSATLRINLNKDLHRKGTPEWLLPKYKLRQENQLCHYLTFISLWSRSIKYNVFRASFLGCLVKYTLVITDFKATTESAALLLHEKAIYYVLLVKLRRVLCFERDKGYNITIYCCAKLLGMKMRICK